MSRYFKKDSNGLAPSEVEGFSLVELLISIGIMVALLAVVVTSQSTYIENVSVGNLAEELSLTFSQAQSYGIAVRELVPGSADFSAPYGLTLSLLSNGSNASYLFFADRNSNRIYDGDWTCQTGGSNECLEKTDILHGNYIDSLCIVRLSGASDLCTVGRVDVTFARPETSAQLAFFDMSGVQMSSSEIKGVRVVLKSQNGITRSVLVYSTGQISLEGNYEYQYPTPYETPYAYEYQYQTPYSYQYQYQYQYQYPTPPPTPTITYSGPTSGTYVVGSGSLNLTTPGTYTITINTPASITVKGVAGGGGGERGGSDSNGAAGGGGGGGGAVNSSGLSVALSSGITYSAIVGSGGSLGSPGQPGGTTKFLISGSTVYLQLNGGGGGGGNGGAGGIAAVGGGENGGVGGDANSGSAGSNGSSGPTGGGGGGGGKSGGDTSPAFVGGSGGSGSDQAGGVGGSAGGHVCDDQGCDSFGGDSGQSASGSGGSGGGGEGGGGGGGGGGKLLGGGYYGGGGGGGGGTVWPPGSGGSGGGGILIIQ